MKTITVKNIPTDVYEKLKKSAKQNRRSINSEIIVCIERAVGSQDINPETVVNHARQLREKTAPYPIPDEELIEARNAGRK